MIQYLLCKLRRNDTQATLIRISIKHLQLEYGSATVVLGKVKTLPQYITKTWVANAWEFFHNENLHIHIPDIQQQEIQCVNDTFLMDMVQNISTTKIKNFNKSRIYLQVITVSDISDATGKNIKQHIQNYNPNTSKLIWPEVQ